MKSIIKPGIVLLIITAIAGGLLGYVSEVTKEPIAEQEALAQQNAMKAVLSQADSFDESTKVEEVVGDATIIEYSKAQNDVGYAVKVSTKKGYGGEIQMMIGIDNEGVIQGVEIVSDSETAGLGAKAKEPAFKDQFIGKSGTLSVNKTSASDTEILAITAATITSKAVTGAVNSVTDYFNSTLKGGTN